MNDDASTFGKTSKMR